MKKARKFLCAVLVVVMCLTSASLSGFDFKAEAADYQVGDIIQFGSYPQSEVKDEALIEKLNELAPEWDEWTSYGYYSGNNDFFGSMVQGDWMRYTDVNYNGKKYRGVKFTQYRPLATYAYGSAENSYQDLMDYYTNTIYWFEFEEVSWLIIDPDTGFVVSNFVLDAQPFSNTVYKKSDSNDGNVYNTLTFSNYANHYETSSIRKWLHEDFYNTAFTDNEKNKICTSTINNDGFVRLSDEDTSIFDGYEQYNYPETQDKIFLLQYSEIPDTNMVKGSAYARCQGLAEDEELGTAWTLRTSGISSMYCCAVGDYMVVDIYRPQLPIYTVYGIRPAFKFKDITDIYTTNPDVSNPDKPEENPEPEKPEEPSNNCSCNCHKGGIAGFFFKLINFFEKIFGINKVCACGVKH